MTARSRLEQIVLIRAGSILHKHGVRGGATCWWEVCEQAELVYAWDIDPAGDAKAFPHGKSEIPSGCGDVAIDQQAAAKSSVSIQILSTATRFQNDGNQWKWLNGPAHFRRYELPRHGGSIFPDYGRLSDVLTTREATYPPSRSTRRPATAGLHELYSQGIAESLPEPQPPMMD